MAPNLKSVFVNVRATPEERACFSSVAAAQQLTVAELIRKTIALEGARLGVPVPASLTAA